MKLRIYPEKWPVFRHWVWACGLGEFLGIGFAAIVAIVYLVWLGEPTSGVEIGINLLVMILAGAVEGTITGFLQWTALKRIFPAIRARRWVFLTAAGAAVAWLLGMLPTIFSAGASPTDGSVEPSTGPMILAGIGMGLVLGPILGGFQFLELRKYWLWAPRWFWANALGWGAGMAFIMAGAALPSSETPVVLIILSALSGGLLGGLAVGLITGWFLPTDRCQTGN